MSARNMAKRTAAGTLALAVCLGGGAIALASAASADANFKFDTRIQGDDRYGTAIAASKAAFDKADNVILVNGYATVDGLTASYLAGVANAPILYVSDKGADDATKAEIKRLGAKNIWLVGGEKVIPASVSDAIKGDGYNVQRINGSDRYETAALIAEAGIKISGKKPSTVFVASGTSFADALAVSPVAFVKGYPIILTDKDSTSDFSKKELGVIGTDSKVLVGGTAVVSDKVAADLSIKSDARVAGDDRAVTANKISDWAKKTQGFNPANAALVGGTNGNGADSLVAAPLLGKSFTTLHFAGWDATAVYMKDHASELTGKGFVFGGKAAVSDSQVSAAQSAANSAAPPKSTIAPTIVSALVTSPNTVVLNFSQQVTQVGSTVDANQFAYDPDAAGGGASPTSPISAVVSADGGSVTLTFGSNVAVDTSTNDYVTYSDSNSLADAGDIVDRSGNQLAPVASFVVGDLQAPTITSVAVINATTVEVTFSEAVASRGSVAYSASNWAYDQDGSGSSNTPVTPTSVNAVGGQPTKVRLTITAGAGNITIGTAAADRVTYTASASPTNGDVVDAAGNRLATVTPADVTDAVRPRISTAVLGAAVSSSTDWNEVNETLTVTFTEDITASGIVADNTAISQSDLNALLGVSVTYAGSSTVTVTHSGTNKLVFTIGGATLTTGINNGASVPGSGSTAVVDGDGNPMKVNSSPVGLS